jgi:glycosyltransferase involved in cell wall biosynthesis
LIKFLIIAQDLRVSGTSEGIVSRSFFGKLRKAYPNAVIDVLYLKSHESKDQLELLPVNKIETHVLNLKIPFFTKWINKLYWRLFHKSLKERHIHSVYASYISKVDYKKYDHVFIRSAGLEHETILACKDLPILNKAIVNFHDPYPLFWYSGKKGVISNLELFKLKAMIEVVSKAKRCMSPSSLLSRDMQFLFNSNKKVFTLQHQFEKSVFNLTDNSQVMSKSKKVTISYHGALMFGRNIDILLDAYQELLIENPNYKDETEFILRLRGQENSRLREKYLNNKNIIILNTLNFSNSCLEQINEADICVILENGPMYSNVLVGKAPFLASLNKLVLCIAPETSEMRSIIKDDLYIASYNNRDEIKFKLKSLIENSLISKNPVYPFEDYFSDENFKKNLDEILEANND